MNMTRFTVRPGFPEHVFFSGPCPDVRVEFYECGFCPGFTSLKYILGFGKNSNKFSGVTLKTLKFLNTRQQISDKIHQYA